MDHEAPTGSLEYLRPEAKHLVKHHIRNLKSQIPSPNRKTSGQKTLGQNPKPKKAGIVSRHAQAYPAHIPNAKNSAP